MQYYPTETEIDRSKSTTPPNEQKHESPSKRRRRKSKQSSRSQRYDLSMTHYSYHCHLSDFFFFRSTSDKGYKSDSSQFRSKSQATNQTPSPLSSLSDAEEIHELNEQFTAATTHTSSSSNSRSPRKRSKHSSRLSKVTNNSEPPLYRVKTRIGEHNFQSMASLS